MEVRAAALVPLCPSLPTRTGKSHGGAFLDSPVRAVCPPQRSAHHKVFAGLAAGGKPSLGWTYGFKRCPCSSLTWGNSWRVA